MATKNYEITVDFTEQLEFRPTKFVRGDAGAYKFVITTVQDLTSSYIVASFSLPDGQAFIDDVTIIDANSAELLLASELTSQAGKVECQLSLYEDGGQLTNSVSFYYIVVDSISAEVDLTIEDNYPVLASLIDDVQNLQNDYQTAEDARDALYVTAEDERDSLYQTAEDARDSAYQTAEDIRDASEVIRISNENTRISNEDDRIDAEDARAFWEDYDATTPYAVGNKVYYENNSYIATQTTTGNTPSLTSAFGN